MTTTIAFRVFLALSLFSIPLFAQTQGAPTSRQIPFSGVQTTIPGPAPAQTLTLRVLNDAIPSSALYCENQTLDVGGDGTISFNLGTGTAANPPCPSAPPGLNPADFASGSSRFLDIVDANGATVLPSPPGSIVLNAVAFALSPGPAGPAGPKGDTGAQGPRGEPGPPGVVQSVSAGDASIAIGGTQASPTVRVAAVPNAALGGTYGNQLTFSNLTNVFSGASLSLPDTTSASAGVLTLGGTRFLHNFGGANTFVGNLAGNMSMTGGGDSGFGVYALANNTTGNQNSAFGSSALYSNTAGLSNSGFGSNALFQNTTGFRNSAFGAQTMQANTTGRDNAAFGVGALSNNTTGSDNAAFGAALSSNTTGAQNAAFGNFALLANSTASNNSAFGYQALERNSTGTKNAAFGGNALLFNGTGSNNSAFGFGALQNNTVDGNSALGASALAANTTGDQNAAFGYSALALNTTGRRNAALGYTALSSNTTGGNNAAFGPGALAANTIGILNVAFGENALWANTTGDANTAFGAGALVLLNGGNSNIAIGQDAGTNLNGNESNNIYIGNRGMAGESNVVRIGSGLGGQTFVFATGNINPWPAFAASRFEVFAKGGSCFDGPNETPGSNFVCLSASGLFPGVMIATSTGAYLSTGGQWTNASDRHLKTNFAPLDGRQILARLAAIPVQSWNYKAEDASIRHIGPTAQDFYAAFHLGADDKAIGTVDESGVALAAIQELYRLALEKDKQIGELTREVRRLRSVLAEMSTQPETKRAAR